MRASSSLSSSISAQHVHYQAVSALAAALECRMREMLEPFFHLSAFYGGDMQIHVDIGVLGVAQPVAAQPPALPQTCEAPQALGSHAQRGTRRVILI